VKIGLFFDIFYFIFSVKSVIARKGVTYVSFILEKYLGLIVELVTSPLVVKKTR